MPSYGIVSKGNGEAWLIYEKHMALSTGGGQAGQGFPCVLVPIGETYEREVSKKNSSNNDRSANGLP